MKQKESDTNTELLRLAVITLLVAAMFGILQHFPAEKTFDELQIGAILKTVASVMLNVSFPIFALYLITLGINNMHKTKRKYIKLQAFFYDTGIFFTAFTILFATLFFFLVWLLIRVPTFPMKLVVAIIRIFIIVSAIVYGALFEKHIRKLSLKVLKLFVD